MSHFTLIVELPAGTKPDDYVTEAEQLLEPYSENKRVEPYRDYIEAATPQDTSLYAALRENGALRDVADADVTWELYVAAYNERYCDGPDDSDWRHVDPERGRVYTMSTYNPDSKWDWWSVGGRWRGYFTVIEKRTPADDELLVLAPRSWSNEGREVDEGRVCDGGPVRLLDLEAMRVAAVANAESRFARYLRAIDGTPDALTWPKVRDVHEVIDDARAAYRNQSRVQALQAEFKDEFGFGCYLEEFKWGHELYVERARLSAVPGYAYLTRTGDWLSPGDMGWFGLSSDTVESREAYDLAVNGRIAALDPETVLLLVDCHI